MTPHPVLSIPELVQEIFQHLESDHTALGRLASVCRDFWQPACEVHWRKVYGVERLLKLLPEEYQVELRECSGWAFRIPSEQDTERVRLYAAFIQEVVIHPGRPPYARGDVLNPRRTLERRGLPMLMLLRPFGPAFPNLVRLHAISETDDSLCTLSRLLSPTLRSLYIHTIQGDNFMVGHFLRAIPVNAPSLQTLEVEALGALSKESEASLLQAARHVSKLSLQAVNPSDAFFRNLAQNNRLRSLVVEFTLARTSPIEVWRPGTFDLLEEFEGEALSAPRTLRLLRAMDMPQLQRLKLTIGTVPRDEVAQEEAHHQPAEPRSVHLIMEKIASFVQLRTLRIVLPNLDDHRLTLSAAIFLPLAACKRLQLFQLIDRSEEEGFDSVFVAWDDQHLMTLLDSWPELHTLHLECSNAQAPRTQLTPGVLLSMAERCPQLRSVRMPIDMTSVGSETCTYPPASNNMYRFTLEASTTIANEVAVTDLIHDLWPLVNVSAWKPIAGPVADDVTRFADLYRRLYSV
ncbi:hypothetical protein DACRYDRAFT_106013 [Dacryopinax primogenitus]|uniref:F-box domain-containing protein n=1 Tax=Dacryopinax primogenitus (strain DJM 731) TaxID=1858805 RepID=M5G6M2_DACPD|nr:uncharacterized protein DACRYDRAFT_106013 [Dacryopinax primogenitus]EJU03855.1 hypothetical protein DACRYDRAFT_106013 [Dacryopinax primogenitus]